MFPHVTGLHRSRLEQIRRSLAMAPSLPGDVAAELLAEVHRLLDIIERSCDDIDNACAALAEVQERLRGC